TSPPLTNASAQFLAGLLGGAVAWGDFNNDGRLDIAASGATNSATGAFPPVFRLYRNDGQGGFTALNPGIVGIMRGAVAWGDLNNDGKLDLLVTGNTNSDVGAPFVTPTTRVYRNDGDGVFTDVNAGVIGLAFSSAAWGDFNNDGWQDIVITGLAV